MSEQLPSSLPAEEFTQDIRKCSLCKKPVAVGQDAGDNPYRHKGCQFACPVCRQAVSEAEAAPAPARGRHMNCYMPKDATSNLAKNLTEQIAMLCRTFGALTGHRIGALSITKDSTISIGIQWGSQDIQVFQKVPANLKGRLA